MSSTPPDCHQVPRMTGIIAATSSLIYVALLLSSACTTLPADAMAFAWIPTAVRRRYAYPPILSPHRIPSPSLFRRSAPVPPRGRRLSIESASTPSASDGDTASLPSLFASAAVYIEDTDAYGVLYHGNYLKFFERELRQHYGRFFPGSTAVVCSVTRQSFRGSPALGDTVYITGTLIRTDGGRGGHDIWAMIMTDAGTGAKLNDATMEIAVTAPGYGAGMRGLENDEPELPPPTLPELASPPYVLKFVAHTDEFEPSIGVPGGALLPLRSAFNYFERARSGFLGGPDALQKMKTQDGVVWVVTSVKDANMFFPEAADVEPEGRVVVKTRMVVKRRGSVVDCYHTLHRGEGGRDDAKEALVSRATITIYCLDATTFRPTSAPVWLLEHMSRSM